MTAVEKRKLSFLLAGGMDNRSVEDIVSPSVQHGGVPTLARSVNTRLGVTPGKIVRSPDVDSFYALNSGANNVSGIMTAATGKRSVHLRGGGVVPTGVVPDVGRTTPATTQSLRTESGRMSAAVAARVSSSAAVATRLAKSQVAVAVNATSGLTWRAYIGPARSSAVDLTELFVEAADDDISVCYGNDTSNVIRTYNGTPNSYWCTITCHGSSKEAVVWYINSAGQLCGRELSISATGITVGSENAIVTPGSVAYGIDIVYRTDLSVVALYPAVGAANDGTMSVIAINTWTTGSSDTITNALQGGGDAAVAVESLGGTLYAIAAYYSITAGTAQARLYTIDSPSVVGTATGLACTGKLAVAFWSESGVGSGFVVFAENDGTGAGYNDYTAVAAHSYTLAVASFGVGLLDIAWRALAGRASSWVTGNANGDIFPIVQLHRRIGLSNEDAGEGNFVDDPSLELWLWTALNNAAAPIARLGVVRGTTAAYDNSYQDEHQVSNTLLVDGTSVYVTYRKSDGQRNAHDPKRAVQTNLVIGEAQHPQANDRDGPAMMAAALPLYWDGSALVELGGPLEPPVVRLDSTPPAGTHAAGDYRVRGVFEWYDAAGLLHRSRPSPLQTITLAINEDIQLGIAEAVGLMGDGARTKMVIYTSDTDGTTLHRAHEYQRISEANVGSRVFTITPITGDEAQIYSEGGNGEELVPQPPPPAHDITVIADRCWIVDAEVRSRAVYSKRRAAGTAFEFVPAFEVVLPEGAGKLQCVRELNGLQIFVTERAIYQIAGEGPSNTLGGYGEFSAPIKVADIGCTNANSVVEYPGGLMWQENGRFVRLTSGGPSYDQVFACTHDVSAAVLMRRYQEILFFSASQAEIRVYHYERNAWTVWDDDTHASAVQTAHVLPYDGDIALIHSSGTSYRLEAANLGAAAAVVLETGWIAPGGDLHDQIELDDIILNGLHDGGSHTITIDIFKDYKTTAVKSETWTNTAIAALGTATGGRFSLRLDASTAGGCRVFKVRVTDALTSGAGMDPRHMTVVYRVAGILCEEAFLAGSRK